ncbi:MAG TPA: hypothetical protein VF170_03090 [Planctomycetaceae bacterium]
MLTWVAAAQGLYYLVTGVWPFVSMRAFEAVTGPKLEHWLVKTVGLLVGVTGAVCLLGVWLGRFTPEVAALALGNAVALTGIDVYYVAIRRIAPIYLADAAAEVVLIAGWAIGWWLGGIQVA